MVYNGYYKVMSNIPKMGHLTTPGSLGNWFHRQQSAAAAQFAASYLRVVVGKSRSTG